VELNKPRRKVIPEGIARAYALDVDEGGALQNVGLDNVLISTGGNTRRVVVTPDLSPS
jgi:thiamine biosynthesis lipoprotein ApbE